MPTMMHDRKAARLDGKPFSVDKVTLLAQADVGVMVFGDAAREGSKKLVTVSMQKIVYVTSGKTAIVPVSELYEPSEPIPERLAELPRYRY
jgi:hypothetical protein